MVRRFASEAIGDQVDESVGQPAGLERNLDNVCRGRLNLGDRQHARRDKRAIGAAIVFLFVRTARHVAGHSGHVTHLANRRRFCRSWRHQRRSNQPNDHKDREQTTDESIKIHDPPYHTGLEAWEGWSTSHVCQPHRRWKKASNLIWLTVTRDLSRSLPRPPRA